MFEVLSQTLNKQELRYLLRKLKVPDDKIQELETEYHGRERLKDRIYNSLIAWKECRPKNATAEELVRILHITGMEETSEKLKAVRVYSQAHRL